ncbi:unnamed protein product [Linum tenue]|uniref:NB-ARC domain-containing protein n=1 Tax=Linum tenue TaxID=586396 RepID=A0AAV0K8Y6_9ROSI|nr:unnamed protein product [Linum tenue]
MITRDSDPGYVDDVHRGRKLIQDRVSQFKVLIILDDVDERFDFKREEKSFWEDTLLRLGKIPHKEIIERLKISYESLDYEAKQVFLDIACFYIGRRKDFPSYMWSDLGFHPVTAITINLPKLRYFEAQQVEFIGDFINILPNIRWLCLPLHKSEGHHPINFPMENLIILDLNCSSNLQDDWGGWSQIKELLELEDLFVLDSNSELEIPPADEDSWWKVSKLKSMMLPSSLTSLLIWDCLESVWLPTLENLENLIHLAIKECSYLGEIQGLDNLLQFNKLETLELTSCPLLTSTFLRGSAGTAAGKIVIESLRELCIRKCGGGIPHLPSFPRLTTLEIGPLTPPDNDDQVNIYLYMNIQGYT